MTKFFWWFEGASVAELIRQLNEAGDGARLEVHPDGQKATLLVVPKGEIGNGDVGTASHTYTHINDSHACPPDCD